MKTRFFKMSGAGNDFILLNGMPKGRSGGALAKKLCDRRRGIGADGLLVMTRKGGRTRLDYWNADGSSAFCGNGSRCAAIWAACSRLDQGRTLSPRHQQRISRGTIDGARTRGSIHAGAGRTGASSALEGAWADVLSSFDKHRSAPRGRLRPERRQNRREDPRTSLALPSKPSEKTGANVDFVQIRDRVVLLRTYERGVEDETLACGTGIVAAAAVARALGKVGDRVTVKVRGGDILHVSFSNGEARLEGQASSRIQGEVEL